MLKLSEQQEALHEEVVVEAPRERPLPRLGPIGYRGPVGEIVNAIAPHSESAPEAILLQLLALLGAMLGRSRYFLVEGTQHHARLNVVLVGATGIGRKGTAWGRAKQVGNGIDSDFMDARLVSGLSSGEGLIHAVRDPRIETQDGEETVVDEGAPDKRLLVCEPEFAQVLKQTERSGNTLSVVLRDSWDGGVLATLTKNSPLRASGSHVVVVGHITAGELVRLLTTTEQSNGFANRFLFCAVGRERLLPFGGDLRDEDLTPLVSDLRSRIARAPEGRFVFSPAARDLWAAAYPNLTAAREGIVGAVTTRLEAYTTRLGLILAVVDGAAEIGVKHLESALELTTYARRSAEWIFGDATGDRIADAIMAYLQDDDGGGLTRTKIRDLLGRHAGGADVEGALERLRRTGRIEIIQQPTAGRPITIVRLAT